jgi:putative membrane protein
VTPAGELVAPGEVWAAWSLEPLTVGGLLALGLGYATGIARLWAGGRRRVIGPRRVAALYGGLGVLALALVSPLHRLGETLFSAHMIQHLLLMMAAAPLLVLGAPGVALALALPRSARALVHRARRFSLVRRARLLGLNPVVIAGAHGAVMWSWHLPALYERAVAVAALHVLEHATLLLLAVAFWGLVLSAGARRRLAHGPAIFLVFVIGLQGAALGAALTFASHPLYPVHAAGASAWGLGAMADQRLAGAIMWVPAGAVYLLVMAVLFLRWMRAAEAAEARPVYRIGEQP